MSSFGSIGKTLLCQVLTCEQQLSFTEKVVNALGTKVFYVAVPLIVTLVAVGCCLNWSRKSVSRQTHTHSPSVDFNPWAREARE